MFHETDEGEWINLATVARVRQGARAGWRLIDAEGQTLGHTISNPETWAHSCVPAAPGFVALRYYHGGRDEPGHVEEQPVIAWAITSQGAMPVILDALPHEWAAYAVQYPDGRVATVGDGTWDDRDAWHRDAVRHAEAADRMDAAA